MLLLTDQRYGRWQELIVWRSSVKPDDFDFDAEIMPVHWTEQARARRATFDAIYAAIERWKQNT